MCWLLAYREDKIQADINDYSDYKKVNEFDKVGYIFQIDEINIQNVKYFNITHNGCSCDFFTSKSKKLRDEFLEFISSRMSIPCVQPNISIQWIDDNLDINLPNEATILHKADLQTIFDKRANGLYRIV